MEYERFERLILIVGGATIALSMGTALVSGSPEPVEVVAQLMLFGVLFAAVKFGRRGGLVAAIVASTIYVLARMNLMSGALPSTTAMLLVASRLLAYGLVGIAVGEACSRIKYSLASVEGRSALDEWSRVYNQRWALKTLDQARGRFRRYGEAFSLVVVTVSPSVMVGVRPSRQRTLTRLTADKIRADVRMVDEVARLDDGRFLVIMPHTPVEGGQVVGARLGTIIRAALGVRDEAVKIECLGLPGNESALDGLIGALSPDDAQESEASSELSPQASGV
jgi:hypothetical protein